MNDDLSHYMIRSLGTVCLLILSEGQLKARVQTPGSLLLIPGCFLSSGCGQITQHSTATHTTSRLGSPSQGARRATI